jgi:hypothetical protein
MERIFIVNNETKEQILHFCKIWTNEFPRVRTKINVRTDGYSIIIDGLEEDVSEFINKLHNNGVTLDI